MPLTRSFGAALAAALLVPSAAGASVQQGSLSDPAEDQAVAGLDLVGLTVRHDTAGPTTVTVRLAGAPSTAPPGVLSVAVGTYTGGDCVPPQIALATRTDETTATGVVATSPDSTIRITATRTYDAATNTITLSTPHMIPGGGEAACAYAVMRDLDAAKPHHDLTRLLFLSSDAPPPAPTPAPTPEPTPAPTPPPTPGAPEHAPAFGKTGKPGKRSYLYGICGRSICRVDARTGRKRTVRRGTSAKNAYTAVSTSVAGTVMAYARKGDIFRGGRNGRKAVRWGSGTTPIVRADGRTVTWSQRQTVKNQPRCYAVPFTGIFECDYLTGYSTYDYVRYRSAGDAEPHGYSSGTTDVAFRGAVMLIAEKGSICAGSTDGDCAQPVASDAPASLVQPHVSANGRLLVAVSEPQPAERGEGAIVLFDARTGAKLRTLTKSRRDWRPVFSPDGKQVAFNRGKHVYVVPARGGKAKRLARSMRLTGPSWSLR